MESAATPAIPAHLGEMTRTWLDAQLRAGGFIDERNSVAGFEVEPLGDGEGFVGELGRLRLQYERDAAGAPETVIAKTPSRLDANRGLGVMMGAYENEIRFYKELRSKVGVPVPACFGATLTAEPRASIVANRVMGQLPGDITMRLLDKLTAAAARSPRRFGLLIEDMHDAVPGDQVAGASFDDAATALRALATVHARFWDSPHLRRSWLRPMDTNRGFTQALFRRAWPTFVERYRQVLPPEVVTLGNYLVDHGEGLLGWSGTTRRTLTHGDFRLDNILYNRDDRGHVTIIDWQGIGSGNGLTDVAYFLRTNVKPEIADSVEDDLVAVYHEALCAHGVRGYSLEQCRADYRLGLAALLHRGALLVGLLDLSHERGQAIVDRAIERSSPKLAEITPAELQAQGIRATRATGR